MRHCAAVFTLTAAVWLSGCGLEEIDSVEIAGASDDQLAVVYWPPGFDSLGRVFRMDPTTGVATAVPNSPKIESAFGSGHGIAWWGAGWEGPLMWLDLDTGERHELVNAEAAEDADTTVVGEQVLINTAGELRFVDFSTGLPTETIAPPASMATADVVTFDAQRILFDQGGFNDDTGTFTSNWFLWNRVTDDLSPITLPGDSESVWASYAEFVGNDRIVAAVQQDDSDADAGVDSCRTVLARHTLGTDTWDEIDAVEFSLDSSQAQPGLSLATYFDILTLFKDYAAIIQVQAGAGQVVYVKMQGLRRCVLAADLAGGTPRELYATTSLPDTPFLAKSPADVVYWVRSTTRELFAYDLATSVLTVTPITGLPAGD